MIDISTGLTGISPASWLAGMAIDPTDMADLVRQCNAAVAAAAGPLLCCDIRGSSGASATIELPPLPGLRAAQVGWHQTTLDVHGLELAISDEVGELATAEAPEVGMAWTSHALSRMTSGWISITASWPGGIGATATRVTMVPSIAVEDMTGAQIEHYIPASRVGDDRPISVGLMAEISAAIWQTWRRPRIYWTWLDPTSYLRPAAGATGCIIAGIPIRCRGRRLGISVQGAGSASARVRVAVGDVVADATGYPEAQGEIVRGSSSAPLPTGTYSADVTVTVPTGGSLEIWSISIYEVPD